MLHLLLYFLALTSLSTASSWAKLSQMPPEVLGFWRLSLAAVILLTYQFVFIRQKFRPSKYELKWILISGFFFFLHLWTYKYAAKHTLISLTMILFATNPIWTAIGNVFAFKQKITIRMMSSFVIAFSGIFLLTYDQLQSSEQNTLGNISALISAVLFAIYLVTGKKARQTLPNVQFSSLQYVVCGFFFLLASLFTQAPLITGYEIKSWASVAGLIFIPTLLGHFLFSGAMTRMNLAVMTCGKLIEPVFASFIAYFLFQEKLSPATYVAFVFTSIAILNLFWPKLSPHLYKSSRKVKLDSP
jgi:drug/metabolite transporter (DMT)-like permease